MGASATLTIPIRISTHQERYDANEILANVAGGTGSSFTDTSATVSLQMPGNIDSLIAKLAAKGILAPGEVTVSVPLRSLAIPDRPSSGAELLEALGRSHLIRNARFAGDRLEATIAPGTGSLRLIYEEAVRAGLMPQDVPTLVNLRGL